jgi:hypothetical protein
VVLGLVFVFFLGAEHSRYAFDAELTQRKARRIDYWYLGAATIGLFIAAIGYSTQREATIVRMGQRLYGVGESQAIGDVKTSIDTLSKFLCVELAPRANEACAGLKKIASEIRPGRSSAEITGISDKLMEYVAVPYSKIFTQDQLSKDNNLFLPIVEVQLKIDEWKTFTDWASRLIKSRSKIDEDTQIILEFGEWVIWPFLLAYALALRITKVTIDVFDWAT